MRSDEGGGAKRRECLISGNRSQRQEGNLEEHKNPRRGATIDEANCRIDESQLCTEQSLEVGDEGCGNPLAGKRPIPNGEGATEPDEGDSCVESINPWTGRALASVAG
jgi:hypothetical protein